MMNLNGHATLGPVHPQASVRWIGDRYCVTIRHHTQTQHYWLRAATEDEAAMTGLDMFEAARSLPGLQP